MFRKVKNHYNNAPFMFSDQCLFVHEKNCSLLNRDKYLYSERDFVDMS